MEHETFVPVPAARVAAALRTPGAVPAALPGWQPDAGADAADRVAHGRLRFRAGGSTVTYRGVVTVEGEDPPFTLVARGTEVRGEGVAEVNLRVTLDETDRPEPGTVLSYEGEAAAGGRLAGYDPAVVAAAARRLLDRFAAALAERAPEADAPAPDRVAPGAEAGTGPAESPARADAEAKPAGDQPQGAAPSEDRAPSGARRPAQGPEETEREPSAEAGAGTEIRGEADTETEADTDTGAPAEAAPADPSGPADAADAGDSTDSAENGTQRPDDADPAAAREEPDVVDDLGDPGGLEEFELVEVELEVPESAAALDDLVPAEAAHARRTMIGRSAEEVDHAPPRGRYAPTPAPDAGSAVAALRWAAPAAAALLASAVVVGRVLRRRR